MNSDQLHVEKYMETRGEISTTNDYTHNTLTGL